MFLYFFSHSPNPYNRLYCRLPIIIIIFILDKTHHSARCSKQKRFIHATHHPTQQAFCPTHVDNAVHFFLTLFFVYPPYNIYPLNSTSFSSDRDWLNNFPTNLPTSFPFLSFSPSILLFSPKRKQLLVLSFCFPFSLFSFSSHQAKKILDFTDFIQPENPNQMHCILDSDDIIIIIITIIQIYTNRIKFSQQKISHSMLSLSLSLSTLFLSNNNIITVFISHFSHNNKDSHNFSRITDNFLVARQLYNPTLVSALVYVSVYCSHSRKRTTQNYQEGKSLFFLVLFFFPSNSNSMECVSVWRTH